MGSFSAGFSGARSGYGEGSCLRCDYSYSQSVSGNYTDFTTNLHMVMSNTPQTYSDSAYGVIAGSFSRSSGSITYSGSGDYFIIGDGTSRFYHNNDGECTVTLRIYGDSGGTSMGSADSTTYIALPTIPRAAGIDSAANTTIGNKVSVKFTPKSSSHHYKLKFTLGSWSYTTSVISPNSTSQKTYNSYTLPMTVCNQLTSTTSGTMSVSLYTYSSSACTTQIGSTGSASFTVYVPDSVKPSISSCSATLSSESANSVVAGWKIFVQNMSKALITAKANGSYGSTINRFVISGTMAATVDGSSLSYTTDYISKCGDNLTFSIVAIDSRGRSSTAVTTNGITVYEYYTPRINNVDIHRDATQKSYVICNVSWEVASVNGNNTTTASLFKYKRRSDTAYSTISDIVANNESPIDSVTFDQNASYDTLFIVTDTVGNSSQVSATLSTIDAVVDFKPNGLGLAVGKMAETNNMFEVDWDTQINGNITLVDANSVLRTLADYIHPVGDIVWTFDSTSPAVRFGGTWELMSEGYFVISAGDNYVPYTNGNLNEYGENTHTLSTDEMPSHNHNVYSRAGNDFTVGNGLGSGCSGIPCGTSGWGDNWGAHWFYGSQDMTYVGGGTAHNNVPLCRAAYCWYRTA